MQLQADPLNPRSQARQPTASAKIRIERVVALPAAGACRGRALSSSNRLARPAAR